MSTAKPCCVEPCCVKSCRVKSCRVKCGNVQFCCLIFSLLAPMLVHAGSAIGPSLTVLMDFESPHSEASLGSLRDGLSQLLGPSGLDVQVKLRSDLPQNAQFGQLVIFKMKGSCSMSAQAARPLYDERGPLALAYTSDGQVLHFGEVECDRVRHSVQRILGRNPSLRNQQAYGSALAVVIAHEVYHMLGNVMDHTRHGLTKRELSAADLTDSKLGMPPIALSAIEKTLNYELAVP